MKKTNFLKFALTLVMAFLFSSTFAQFVAQDASAPEAIDSVTVGATVPYFVEPDSYFSPGWVVATPTVGVTTTFVWAAPTGGGATVNDATPGDNYIEYSWNTTGTKGLSVQETAAGCAGTAVTMNVEVVDSTLISYTASNGTGIIGTDSTFCDGTSTTDYLQVTFSDPYTYLRNYRLAYTYVVDTMESGGAWNNATTVNHTVAGSGLVSVNATTYDLNDHANNFTTLGTPVAKRTRYVYTLLGVSDRISRKSDYLNNTAEPFRLYDYVAKVITITVNPAPVTGPIYHISNTWSL